MPDTAMKHDESGASGITMLRGAIGTTARPGRRSATICQVAIACLATGLTSCQPTLG